MTSMSGTRRGGVGQVVLVDQKLSNQLKRKLRPTESESEIYILHKKLSLSVKEQMRLGKGVILRWKQQA